MKVLVAEDSVVARQLITSILSRADGMDVVGEATNGAEAVRMAQRLRPDVITMDVHMPVMNGLEATRQIMASIARPIVVVSAIDPKDVELSFQAMEAGAVAVLGKPPGPASPDFARVSADLVRTVRSMAGVRVITRRSSLSSGAAPENGGTRELPPLPGGTSTARVPGRPPTTLGGAQGAGGANGATQERAKFAAMSGVPRFTVRPDVLGIASSTGGPEALKRVLEPLPRSFPLPILVVQHITDGFHEGLVRYLDSVTALDVRIAGDGETPRPGQVLVAAGGSHLEVVGGGRTRLDRAEGAVGGHRPAATKLFRSLARVHGARALGLILTGMGADGVDGLADLKAVGGRVIAQDEATSVVFGMPGEAVRRGLADDVLPIDAIAQTLMAAR